jgi:hypothetical protein
MLLKQSKKGSKSDKTTFFVSPISQAQDHFFIWLSQFLLALHVGTLDSWNQLILYKTPMLGAFKHAPCQSSPSDSQATVNQYVFPLYLKVVNFDFDQSYFYIASLEPA